MKKAMALAAVLAALVICVVYVAGPVPADAHPAASRDRSIFAAAVVPPEVEKIFKRSCMDCHSNETRWPWYSRLPVVSTLLARDVENARQHLNLSDWQSTLERGEEESQGLLNGICEEVRMGNMPLKKYLRLHRDAALSHADVETLCAWTDTRTTDVIPSTH